MTYLRINLKTLFVNLAPGFDRTGNVILSSDPENPILERNMNWIG